MTDWSHIAQAFNEVPEDRFRILCPLVWEVLRRRGVNSLVDHGGGDGRFLEQVIGPVSPAFPKIALVEPAADMRRLATGRLSRRGAVVAHPGELPQGEWDAVIQIAVWMCLRDEATCASVLRDIRGLLRDGGVFLAAVTHPCFRDRSFGTFRPHFDMRSYTDNGSAFEVEIGRDAATVRVTDYHWNLEAMTRQLDEAGFRLRKMYEPKEPDRQGEGAPWLVLECEKAALD